MYKIARIKLRAKNSVEEDCSDEIYALLGMLYKNGQILYDYVVEDHNNYYVATVTTTDDDSLDSIYFNKYIVKGLEKIEMSYDIISNSADAEDSCRCSKHRFYVLATFYEDESSPILCGDCGKEIPLIHIPYISGEEEHFSILTFQRTYSKVDGLWMVSLSDRFTKRQLTSYDSELTKRGLEICNELEKKVEKPVYYLLPNKDFYNIKNENTTIEVCPKCNENLIDVDSEQSIDKVCKECRFAFK